jgi:2-dehydro-3-deoxyphosphooctonate aldolase (KDO 8-P synthase)
MARAAVAIGVSALFIEVHQDPESAPSDGPNMIRLDNFEKTLDDLIELDIISKRSLNRG